MRKQGGEWKKAATGVYRECLGTLEHGFRGVHIPLGRVDIILPIETPRGLNGYTFARYIVSLVFHPVGRKGSKTRLSVRF